MIRRNFNWRMFAFKLAIMYLRFMPLIMLALRAPQAFGYDCDTRKVNCSPAGRGDNWKCGVISTSLTCSVPVEGYYYLLGAVEAIYRAVYGNDCDGKQPEPHVVKESLVSLAESLLKSLGFEATCSYKALQPGYEPIMSLLTSVDGKREEIFRQCMQNFLVIRPFKDSAVTTVEVGFVGDTNRSATTSALIQAMEKVLEPTFADLDKHASTCRTAGIVTISSSAAILMLLYVVYFVFCCCLFSCCCSDSIKESMGELFSGAHERYDKVKRSVVAYKDAVCGFFNRGREQYRPVGSDSSEEASFQAVVPYQQDLVPSQKSCSERGSEFNP